MDKTNRSPDTLMRRVQCNECEATLPNGTETCSECGGNDINQDWNTLESAYAKHDVGEAFFTGRCVEVGFTVEAWGIDMRGADEMIYDDQMDLRLWRGVGDEVVANQPDGELAAVADVKTKANDDWMGICNLRHLVHYAEWAVEFDVPVFVFFTMVDADNDVVGDESFSVVIDPDDIDYLDDYTEYYDRDVGYTDLTLGNAAEDFDIVERVFTAPDGNTVVKLDEQYYTDTTTLLRDI